LPTESDAATQVERTMRAATMTAMGLAAATMVPVTSGAELTVPSKQFPTIQAAVSAAVDGDVIRLAAGTFIESCTVQGKSISFVGSGINATTWQAPSGHRCLWMPFLDSKTVVISDIHFTGFSMPYNAAAVDLESTGAHRIARCRFSASGYFPLEVFGGGAVIEDCEFVGNSGRGISMTIPRGQVGAEQQILRCRFIDNRNPIDAGSSAITVYNAQVRIEYCTFSRNNFPKGNGIAIEVNSGSAVVANSEFCESGANSVVGAWQDGGGNSLSTEPCVLPCVADLVIDNTVNAADMAIVLNFWGTNGSQFPGVDIDGDGVVNGSDLAAVLNAWGPCPQ
jgi:polygalacturonase